MGRLMAIDYGSKRVGIAVSDTLKIIATGLTTVHSKDLINFLENYFSKEEVELVIIGEARKLNNELSDSARFIEPFVKHFSRKFPGMKIVRLDERFTSTIAQKVMLESGLRKKQRQDKGTVDLISATILLQDYMAGSGR